MKKMNLVLFYSEGGDKDNGLPLTTEKDIMFESAKNAVDNISVYNPTILKNMGYEYHVKEREKAGLASCNPGVQSIGFFAWKPLIMLLELEKMNDGDILVYRDVNCTKIEVYKNYDNFRENVEGFINYVNFDFFVSRCHEGWVEPFSHKFFCKTNTIRELGENHPFSYNYPMIWAGFICVRKSDISIKLLKDWLHACENEEWINGEQYGELQDGFVWSCSEQSLLSLIISNWIRKRVHNIPINYPQVVFAERDLNRGYSNIDMRYLEYLHP